MKLTEFNFRPIGVVRSPFKTKFGTPRQPHVVPAARATIEIFPHADLNGCLVGLKQFSHVWIVFVFHENTNHKVRGKVHPPRLEGQKVGLFSTRSPHRPNPIGLSSAKLESVNDWMIEVSGVDVIDGTPVLDIKPYLASSDSIPDATEGWVTQRQWTTLPVVFSPTAERQLVDLTETDPYPVSTAQGPTLNPVSDHESRLDPVSVSFRELIVQTLSQDPRPTVYKQDVEGKYRSDHVVLLNDKDVVFQFQVDQIVVVEIRPSRPS
jgi:tRNA-Thr(GGU) m(6)t(6)A37 methyltransferase TsaA